MSHAFKLNFDLDEVSKKQFDFFVGLIFTYTGIYLAENEKNYSLLNNRLRKVLRSNGFDNYDSLMTALASNPSPSLKEEFINCLTTNKTNFFREKEHFNKLPELIKDLMKTTNPIYMWSSACSTGQEPYTLAMHLHDTYGPENFDRFKILATDIDTEVLKTATEGFYQESHMEGLSPQQIRAHFDNVADCNIVKDHIKNKVHFSQLNLFKPPYSINRKFDVIFCRNVLIYFKPEDRLKVCNQLLSYLNVGGHLIVGLSEAGSVQLEGVESIGNSTYRKVR
jgi:chemotaxis protein methyltransferase CheR